MIAIHTGKMRLAQRLLLLALVLCLLPSLPHQGKAQEELITNLFGARLMEEQTRFSNSETIHSTALLGDTLYIRTTTALYSFSPGDREAVYRAELNSFHIGRIMDAETVDKETDYVPGSAITYILSDGQRLLGLDVQDLALYTLSLEGGKVQVSDKLVLDLSDFIEGEPPYLYLQSPAWALVDSGSLYLKKNNYGDASADLYSFDLKTGEKTLHPVAHLQSAAPYKDGKLVALLFNPSDAWDSETQSMRKPDIVIFDPIANTVERVGSYEQASENTGNLQSIYYDAAEDSLYTYTDTDLFRYDDSFKTSRTIGYLPMFGQYHGSERINLLPLPDGRLAVGFPKNIFIRERTEKGLEGITALTIGGGIDNDGDLVKVLMQMDKVVLRRADVKWGAVSEEQLASMFLTGQMGVDIMPLNVKGFDLDKLIQKGYLADLSGNAYIREEVANITPNLRTAYARDGSIYAVPANLLVFPINYYHQRFEATGIPLPESLEGLLDLTEEWMGGLAEQHPDYALFSGEQNLKQVLRRLLLDTYIDSRFGAGQDLAFDTPAFRSLAQRIESMNYGDHAAEIDWSDPASVAIMEEFWEKKGLLEINMGFEPRFIAHHNNLGESGTRPLYLPLTGDMAYYKDADFTMLAVLSTSQHLEVATRFVELYLAGRSPQDRISLNPAFQEDLPNPNYEADLMGNAKLLADMEKEYARAEGAEKSNMEQYITIMRKEYEDNKELLKYLLTKEDVENIHTLISKLYLMNGLQNAQRQAFYADYQLLQQYYEGAISLDQFIKTMDDKLRLVRMEYQ